MPKNDHITTYQAALLTIQDAAKQLGVVIPLLQAAYFAIVSMSELRKAIWGNWMWAAIFTCPAILWLISLFLTIRVFVPPLVSPEAQGKASTYEYIVHEKYRLLRLSQYFLLAGLLSMIINVGIYFVYIPLPPPSK